MNGARETKSSNMCYLWFEREVKPRLRDRAFLVRCADDFVIGFRDHRDAQRVMEVIPKRFGKFGLTIHPTKSRLVPFRPSCPWANDDRGEPPDPPETFDLLGFNWVARLYRDPFGVSMEYGLREPF